MFFFCGSHGSKSNKDTNKKEIKGRDKELNDVVSLRQFTTTSSVSDAFCMTIRYNLGPVDHTHRMQEGVDHRW